MQTLILSCNTGAGHNSCAQAVQEAYHSRGEKSSNECREVTEKYRTGRSAYLWLGQLFMRLFAGLL